MPLTSISAITPAFYRLEMPPKAKKPNKAQLLAEAIAALESQQDDWMRERILLQTKLAFARRFLSRRLEEKETEEVMLTRVSRTRASHSAKSDSRQVVLREATAELTSAVAQDARSIAEQLSHVTDLQDEVRRKATRSAESRQAVVGAGRAVSATTGRTRVAIEKALERRLAALMHETFTVSAMFRETEKRVVAPQKVGRGRGGQSEGGDKKKPSSNVLTTGVGRGAIPWGELCIRTEAVMGHMGAKALASAHFTAAARAAITMSPERRAPLDGAFSTSQCPPQPFLERSRPVVVATSHGPRPPVIAQHVVIVHPSASYVWRLSQALLLASPTVYVTAIIVDEGSPPERPTPHLPPPRAAKDMPGDRVAQQQHDPPSALSAVDALACRLSLRTIFMADAAAASGNKGSRHHPEGQGGTDARSATSAAREDATRAIAAVIYSVASQLSGECEALLVVGGRVVIEADHDQGKEYVGWHGYDDAEGHDDDHGQRKAPAAQKRGLVIGGARLDLNDLVNTFIKSSNHETLRVSLLVDVVGASVSTTTTTTAAAAATRDSFPSTVVQHRDGYGVFIPCRPWDDPVASHATSPWGPVAIRYGSSMPTTTTTSTTAPTLTTNAASSPATTGEPHAAAAVSTTTCCWAASPCFHGSMAQTFLLVCELMASSVEDDAPLLPHMADDMLLFHSAASSPVGVVKEEGHQNEWISRARKVLRCRQDWLRQCSRPTTAASTSDNDGMIQGNWSSRGFLGLPWPVERVRATMVSLLCPSSPSPSATAAVALPHRHPSGVFEVVWDHTRWPSWAQSAASHVKRGTYEGGQAHPPVDTVVADSLLRTWAMTPCAVEAQMAVVVPDDNDNDHEAPLPEPAAIEQELRRAMREQMNDRCHRGVFGALDDRPVIDSVRCGDVEVEDGGQDSSAVATQRHWYFVATCLSCEGFCNAVNASLDDLIKTEGWSAANVNDRLTDIAAASFPVVSWVRPVNLGQPWAVPPRGAAVTNTATVTFFVDLRLGGCQLQRKAANGGSSGAMTATVSALFCRLLRRDHKALFFDSVAVRVAPFRLTVEVCQAAATLLERRCHATWQAVQLHSPSSESARDPRPSVPSLVILDVLRIPALAQLSTVAQAIEQQHVKMDRPEELSTELQRAIGQPRVNDRAPSSSFSEDDTRHGTGVGTKKHLYPGSVHGGVRLGFVVRPRWPALSTRLILQEPSTIRLDCLISFAVDDPGIWSSTEVARCATTTVAAQRRMAAAALAMLSRTLPTEVLATLRFSCAFNSYPAAHVSETSSEQQASTVHPVSVHVERRLPPWALGMDHFCDEAVPQHLSSSQKVDPSLPTRVDRASSRSLHSAASPAIVAYPPGHVRGAPCGDGVAAVRVPEELCYFSPANSSGSDDGDGGSKGGSRRFAAVTVPQVGATASPSTGGRHAAAIVVVFSPTFLAYSIQQMYAAMTTLPTGV